MILPNTGFSDKQIVFREMVLGTLIYAVVLGMFNDYTAIFYTKSYSTTFMVALVMQVLTYLTLLLKKMVAGWFRRKPGFGNKAGLIVGVWLILFLSKFVFLAVIDFVFGSSVQIGSFTGIMVIILAMTITKTCIDYAFNKLAD